ncbi:MAG: signal peptidase I [Candidatus Magasanikbacteria bacterium RIFCSPHIGHO2_02_FULL_47_14]|uniref:Signal peptidase I n=1 Tax=Candidatus Magasanikbacteria bacterium RIFCSPHIGHO2_02_FULL_47_14 TaxID=1798680 RepID=A0A1F6M1F5_9BACT|nr:MAG: signal peptidase I [Candidatus Magasanikbacteria bacterium RIFCSPHIGHO2_02_FULL_47_14]
MIKVALLAGVTIALVRYFLFKPFYVKGQSMEPSYYAKEYLIIDEITYRFREPERGEVVVFKAPFEKDDYYIKRVLGLPGERVKIEDGKVIIYNEQYPEGVVTEERYLEEKTPGSINVSLGPDQYFVMGDNRDESFDSRRFGPVSRDAIVGRTWLREWPVTRAGLFQKPQYNL